MKSLHRFLLAALALTATPAFATPVAQTMGSNLTAYNGASGAMTNNAWNNMMNARSGGDGATSAPTADFGNCNALILRCAQPKCANGGCTDMTVTSSIVAGCVNANDTCKKYGDDLVQYISAQLVASSTAKVQQQQLAAQQSAATAAAQQSAAQMQQMQAQMQQMQSDMAAQNAAQIQQMQAALDEQKQLTANAIAAANAAQTAQPAATPVTSGNLTAAQTSAAAAGVSADVLAREQISGKIMSAVESAETAMKDLKATMQDVFDYAGCDASGNNCTGPRRVKAFKQRAMEFFEPYNAVLDEMYDALIMAESVGVDISDIYMLLNDSCHSWALYMCENSDMRNFAFRYNNNNCDPTTGMSNTLGNVYGGQPCKRGQIVPEKDGGCQMIQLLSSEDEIMRHWIDPEEGEKSLIRVGCASDALDNSWLGRNRKKNSTIDVGILERIIEQDAPASYGTGYFGDTTTAADGAKFCAINAASYADLQQAVNLKKLPDTICVSKTVIDNNPLGATGVVPDSEFANEATSCQRRGGTYQDYSCRCNGRVMLSYETCNNGQIDEDAGTIDMIGASTCNARGGYIDMSDGLCKCGGQFLMMGNRCQDGNAVLDMSQDYNDDLTAADKYDLVSKANDILSSIGQTTNVAANECKGRGGNYINNKCMCGGADLPLGAECEMGKVKWIFNK